MNGITDIPLFHELFSVQMGITKICEKYNTIRRLTLKE